MKPAADKRFLGGFFVLQVPLHHDVAAEHNLADGLTVTRHFVHRFGIDHSHGFLKRVGHALPAFQLGTLLGRQLVPARLLRANRCWTINFSQPIDMGELDSDAFGTLEHRDRRCCACDQTDHLPCGGAFRRIWRVDQAIVHDRRARHVGDAMLPDQFEDLGGVDLAQADVDAR